MYNYIKNKINNYYMSHTATIETQQNVDADMSAQMLWNLLQAYDEPIKLLLARFGCEMVNRYFPYDYAEWLIDKKRDNK